MNLVEIENTIKELESGEATFASCEKLANLYIVRDHLLPKDEVVKEYTDIFTAYEKFCSTKADYQQNKLPKEAVIADINLLCNEVYEFLLILYSNSDMTEEREAIFKHLDKFYIKLR